MFEPVPDIIVFVRLFQTTKSVVHCGWYCKLRTEGHCSRMLWPAGVIESSGEVATGTVRGVTSLRPMFRVVTGRTKVP